MLKRIVMVSMSIALGLGVGLAVKPAPTNEIPEVCQEAFLQLGRAYIDVSYALIEEDYTDAKTHSEKATEALNTWEAQCLPE